VPALTASEAEFLQQQLDAQFSSGRLTVTPDESPNAFAIVQQASAIAGRTQVASPTKRIIQVTAATGERFELNVWRRVMTDIATAALADGFVRSADWNCRASR